MDPVDDDPFAGCVSRAPDFADGLDGVSDGFYNQCDGFDVQDFMDELLVDSRGELS